MVDIDNLIRKALMEGYRNTVINTEKSDALFDFLLMWRKEFECCIDDAPDGRKEQGL